MKMTDHTALWEDFRASSPKTVDNVKTLLSQGKNVVMVMTDRLAACHPYRDRTTPFEAAMTLEEKLVSQTGVPLSIGAEGLPVFAFLAWRSTDPFDTPSESGVVAMAGRPSEAMEPILDSLTQLGIGKCVKQKNLYEL
jgi:hypothetical protein